jgi:hypothetical protein
VWPLCSRTLFVRHPPALSRSRVKAEPLIFPDGVRFAREDEIPAGSRAGWDRIAHARITTGYTHREHTGATFRAFFEANVHAPQLWLAFRALAEALLPEFAAPIVGMKDEEPVLIPPTTLPAALAVLEPHRRYLQHDGFLEFGVVSHVADVTEEVFVKSAKYLQVWTNQPDRAAATFADLGLPHVPNLEFLDGYPRVSRSLLNEAGNAEWPDVVEQLRTAFHLLPPAQALSTDV